MIETSVESISCLSSRFERGPRTLAVAVALVACSGGEPAIRLALGGESV